MTSPIALTIGGTSYTAVKEDSMVINSVLGKTINTMQLTLYDKNCTLTVPKEGVDVIVTRTDTGERIFGGLASNIIGHVEGVSRYWDIQCQSYTVLLDRILFYYYYPPCFTYTNLAAQALVGDVAILGHMFEKSVVGMYGQATTASEIAVSPTYVQQGSPSLVALNVNYMYAREAIELLANYVGFNYYVDYNKNLHYYYKETNLPPFCLSSASAQLPDSAGNLLDPIEYNGMIWQRDATRIINNYLVFGTSVSSDTKTSTIANNGVKTTLSMAFNGTASPILPPPGKAQVEVYVNSGSDVSPTWVTQTVGTMYIDDAGSYNVLADYTNLVLNFAVAPPNLTLAVKVNYLYQFQGGMPDSAQDSITQYGRLFSTRMTAADANSAAAMQSNINHLKTQFKGALEKVTCKVDDSAFPAGNTNRFKIGQWVPFYNHILGTPTSATLLKNYQVYSMKTRCLGGSVLSYELELRNWMLE